MRFYFLIYRTALYLAVENNNADIVQFLTEDLNIDPNIKIILNL